MVFEQGFFGGFLSFMLRPFTNPVGWILIICAIIWIYLRISGKVGSKTRREGGSGGADYIIK